MLIQIRIVQLNIILNLQKPYRYSIIFKFEPLKVYTLSIKGVFSPSLNPEPGFGTEIESSP